LRKTLGALAVPALVLAAAILLLPRVAALPPPLHRLAGYAPWLLTALGMLLSLRFNRGRVFFVLAVLALAAAGYREFLWRQPPSLAADAVRAVVCLLPPLNIALFCWLKERGVLTVHGALRFGWLLLQLSVAAWIILARRAELLHVLQRTWLPAHWLAWTNLPQPVLAAIGLSVLAVAGKIAVKPAPIEIGLLGALAAFAVGCYWLAAANAFFLLVSAAALILTLSVVQDSYHMAYRDELSGLPGRRALNEALLGLGRHYTVAMLDVDHFKRFNTRYGHDVGDQVLKMTAAHMMRVGGGGRPFRYGGEEFTVLFPRKDADEAVPHLEALRQAIAASRLVLRGADRPPQATQGKTMRGGKRGGGGVAVTISIGVAQRDEQHKTPATVVKAADQALYRAKNKGRNQTSR